MEAFLVALLTIVVILALAALLGFTLVSTIGALTDGAGDARREVDYHRVPEGDYRKGVTKWLYDLAYKRHIYKTTKREEARKALSRQRWEEKHKHD